MLLNVSLQFCSKQPLLTSFYFAIFSIFPFSRQSCQTNMYKDTFLPAPSFSSIVFLFLSIFSHTLRVKSHLCSSNCCTWVIFFCEAQVYDLNTFIYCWTCIWQQLQAVFSQTWVLFHASVSASGAWENLKVQLWGTKPLQTGGEEESDLWPDNAHRTD